MNLAFTFIGTIIGAGFASGQEIRKYFVDFGINGIIGIALVTFLFIFVGEKIMLMGYTTNANSYNEVLNFGFGNKTKKIIDYILCFVLLATASTMFSGAGAFFEQSIGVNRIIVSAIVEIATIAVIFLGINGVTKISAVIVPVLILLTSIISIVSLGKADFGNFTLINELKTNNIWAVLFSAIIYAAYNTTMGLAVLPLLGSATDSKRKIKFISIFSGVVIGVFGAIIYFALLTNYSKIQGAEIPIATLAGSSYGIIYGISFIIAVFTTAVGCLYGVYTRFNKNIPIFSAICLIAYVISLLGFSTLVSKLYYAIGIFGIFLLAKLLFGYARKRDITKE